ncbi:helix-turn-helix domain-containing protein [Glutamicibacter arilaitensis]|uniref:helix-turn-helix domain-containing protein n=1 Tax=Glutamicibacter arilaitensis TaxID=256701 RepID=UPI003FD1AA2A
MSIINTVSANIRVELARGGMTQESLAAGINKNAVSLSRQLRGLQEFKLSDLEKIADFLNVEVADLFIPQTRKNVHETSGAAS